MRCYAVIYADPPWRYTQQLHGHGGAEDHYPTMALEDIKAIRVPASDDCALFLWATMPLLRQAFEVIEARGFKYKTTAFCWVKQTKSGDGFVTGLGSWTRSNAEVCLLATRGRPRPVSHRVHSVVITPRRRHSQKPDEVRERIVELMGNLPRLEMFARSRTPGWDVWGNEVKNSIELKVPQQDDVRGDGERRWRRCSIAS
jgi:site-specific DNA-methyltransferase (adenine-specific)